ncbi:MAG: hypothetical protein FJ189_02740 [Gammaproteobacteria bacterium]|nr:hypothetical protein [Gammaproteobacteria bacterium]
MTTQDDQLSSKTASRARRGRAAEPGPIAPEAPAAAAADSPAAGPRFHFFLIDSGWNSAAARVIRENIGMITRFQNDDPLFILDQEQSTALMRRHPHLIGKDPILLARDLRARGASGDGDGEYHGFHLNMGLVKDPVAAVAGLRKFLHLLAVHRHGGDIEQVVTKELHRAGMKGAIEVLRTGHEAMLG